MLRPCPFCGNRFEEKSYDRVISFKCQTCNYERSFPGLLQSKPDPNNVVRVPHCDKDGIRIEFENEEEWQIEYYHKDAFEIARIKMNQRIGE